MNRRHILGLTAGLGLAMSKAATAAPQVFVMSETPKSIPELQFTNNDNKILSLADFKGKVVLLNIWATWCAPCRKEMPMLDRLQAALGRPDFEVVPLSIDRGGLDAVKKFYTDSGIQHLSQYVSSSSQTLQDLAIVGLPTTLLIGRKSQELSRLIGPAEWDSPDMINILKSLINQQKETTP